MGLTKQYLRYVESGPCFGTIASPNSQLAFIEVNGESGKHLATAACENVIIWEIKTGNKIKLLSANKAQITTLASTYSNNRLLAVGFADGSINVFDYASGELKVTFTGHKSAVSCLCFDDTGMRLASGSKDTEVVVWDIVNESGLFRLKGHKNLVTKCCFMKTRNILVTSSKDTFIKFWDLETQHCFKTLMAHRTEIWSFVLLKNDTLLITGSSELKVWEIEFTDNKEDSTSNQLERVIEQKDVNEEEEEENADDDQILRVKNIGSILRKSVSRLQFLGVNKTEQVLICNGADNFVECFKIRTEEEIKSYISKRLRKEKRKLKRNEDGSFVENDSITKKTLTDEIERLEVFKASAKIKHCDIVLCGNSARIAVLLQSNAVEIFNLDIKQKSVNMFRSLEIEGHRTDVRTVAFSSDNFFILSASADSLKVWNRSSKKCIATVKDGFEYALCSLFTPSNRHCVTGTKTGKLQIFDIGSAQILESIEASDDASPIWSICMYPNERGIASGGEDKMVKFWDFEFLNDEKLKNKRLTLVQTRALNLQEGVLVVKISPDNRLIAASLLDNTVKIFFFDTLKFFLSLYGHKFPVLSMDISYDSKIIATGSSDKNLKLWGLDFGDCHKSIFAHDDNIMDIQFIPKTHYLFTCSKDKTIKQWDADNFEKIVTLKGHHNEVWNLAVSPNGNFLVSASHDKSLRLWEKTEEPLVLEDEREVEREEEFEKSEFIEENVIPGETNEETGLASKKTSETLKAAEKLIEAIDIFKEEISIQKSYALQCEKRNKEGKEPPAAPALNPLMMVYNTTCPHRFILEVLRRIKHSELEEALLTLPFNYVIDLFYILTTHLEKGWEVELICRALSFLSRYYVMCETSFLFILITFRVHFGQILSSSKLVPVVDRLRTLMVLRVNQLRVSFIVRNRG
ncbi:WD repeat-containing protein 3-like protein [Dinothrombium tinctorium]|uniref:WD repeat-containing protein 3-like protein n=1 Tax=Dinothrombium tinctorium TaxID=1965070 RepID=A0A3S3PQ75_9ACAR|nr:WD repeat-containing protein 3-like protein [Dinothrombium tinctorium]RWS06087.1 WD repeat-containing protein 3-like protein [Dinothrombium tinctorium]